MDKCRIEESKVTIIWPVITDRGPGVRYETYFQDSEGFQACCAKAGVDYLELKKALDGVEK